MTNSGMKRYGFSFHALGGGNELQLYAHSETEAAMVAGKLVSRLEALERKYSRYRPDSVVSAINRSAGGRAIEVDDETADLLDFAEICYRKSGGLFDLTSGVLRRAWNFKQSRVPDPEELAMILISVGWEKVEWRRPFLRLSLPGMEIDFGGIGKEYGTDLLAEICKKSGIEHALINLGGDLRAVGPHPDGTPWRLGIRHPRIKHRVLRVFEITSGALTTSGDYERFFEVDGKRYCHILNPRTGLPVIHSRSVTVTAPSCLFAGSLSTIGMLLPAPEARALLHKQHTPFFQVDSEGRCWDENGESGTTTERAVEPLEFMTG